MGNDVTLMDKWYRKDTNKVRTEHLKYNYKRSSSSYIGIPSLCTALQCSDIKCCILPRSLDNRALADLAGETGFWHAHT